MSTTALPPNLSPAYQPRSFRGASPYPAPPSASSSSLTGGKVGRSLSAHRLEHPLPSRPSTSLPPVPGASARVNAEPISAGAPSSNGNSPLVHRPPPSPAMSAFDERRGRSSGLRNEVKRAEVRQDDSRIKDGKREGREDGAAAQMRKEARSILQLLRRLPAPLPEFLPSTYLPPKNTEKSPTPEGSFTEFVHTQRANSSSASSSSSSSSPTNLAHPLGNSESSLGKRRRTSSPLASTRDRPATSSVGLGLGLVEAPIPKKSKSAGHLGNAGSAAMTPSMSLPLGSRGNGPRSPELMRTASTGNVHARALTPTPTKDRSDGYKPRRPSNQTGSPPAGADKISWSRAKWGEAAERYRDRALLSKRHGDAHNGIPKREFAHLPADALLAHLRLTDAVLMYMYSFWANEQSTGRVRGTPYGESQPLREMVRKMWERHAGSLDAGHEKEREMARGMIGLMYLVDAVVNHHLATETIIHLGARNRRLSQQDSSGAGSASMSRGGNGSTSATAPAPHGHGTSTNGTGLGPSPPSDHSPSNSLLDPSPHSASSTSPEIPADISNMITNGVTQSSNASQSLLNARHYLSLSRLRRSFPDTFDAAIHCELSDEALPAPNDTLGAARKVDIDHLDQFVWPIELGMCAPIAHLSVFGRRLVKEFADKMGKEWDVRLGEKV